MTAALKRNRIVVVGSSNTDMVMQLPHLPRPGETEIGGAFTMAAGGKGANQAVAAARAGGTVTLVARVGMDMFGESAIAGFRRDSIGTEFVFRDGATPSGTALIFVGQDSGENCIGVASGANARLSPADVRRARRAIAGASMLIMQLETPIDTVMAAASIANRAGVPVILNPAPARPLPDRLLKKVSILTPNETEAEMLTGVKVGNLARVAEAAGRLLEKGVGTVIITLGRRGSFVATRDKKTLVPGFQVKAVDTTAAGDVYNGALAVALGEGKTVVEAARFANAAGAIAVTRLGAQPSAPARREIDALLSRGRGTRSRA